MPRSAKEKENNPRSGTETERPRSARERVPTEKVSTTRAEQAASAERREARKARKAERARRAMDDSDDERDDNEDESGASTTFKTHTVGSKSVAVKTKALAQRDNVPTQVKATPNVKTRTVASDSVHVKTKAVTTAKRDHLPAKVYTRERTPEDDSDEQDNDQPDEQDNDQPEEDEDEPQGDENRGPSPEVEEPDSPSTQNFVGLKRRRASADSLIEAKIQRTTSGRPKAADYDDTQKALIVSAISYYRANLSSACAFPDIATEADMLGEVWKFTCTELETTTAITPQIAKLITSRGSQLRGELKTKARPLVEGYYGFESGLNRKMVAKNRKTAENLKEGKGFVYKITAADPAERKGMYQAKIVQKVVNVMWFRNKQDEGVIHEANFNPLSIQALALTLTAIECCIDEWISGIRTDVPFSSALYKDVYEDHIRCLERFDEVTKHMILPNILLKLYNRGRFHAGALPISSVSVPTISDSAFQAALKEYEEDSHTETDGENGDSD